MRILHVIAQLPKMTGSGVYFTNLVGFMEKEHENAVIYGIQDEVKVQFSENTIKYPVKFKSYLLNFPIVGMSDEMPYNSTKYCDLTDEMLIKWRNAFSKNLERAKIEFEPDIVITHHSWMLSSLVLDIFENIPVVIVNHGTDIRQTKLNPKLFKKYVNNLNRAKRVFALSQKDADQVEKIFNIDKEKILVMGGGFNSKVFYKKNHFIKEDEKIRIMFAGKLSHAKGVYELCSAFKILEQKHDNLILKLIGDTDKKTKLELLNNTGNSKHLKIYNTCCQQALANIMRKVDIYVLPSYYEGLGLVAIEALASGMRVVATEIDGLIQTLGDEINKSDIIEYVKMPKLELIDKPYDEEIEPFIKRLVSKIDLQINRVKKNEEIDKSIDDLILEHSWDSIMTDIEDILLDIK